MHFLLDKFTIKHKVLLLVTTNILFIMLFYFVMIVPQKEQILQAREQFDTENKTVTTVEAFAASKPNIDQYLADLDVKMNQINNMLPNDPEMSDFLKQAEQYARETGVVLMQVHTGQIANKTGYREIPIDISIQGSYLKTVNFVKKLEDGARFIVVRNIQMNAQNKVDQSQQDTGKLHTSLQLGTQPIIGSKLSVVIFGYGVPTQPKKDGQLNQGQNGQQQAPKK